MHRLRFGDSTLFGNIARIASSYVSTDDRTSDRGVPHVLSTLQNIAQVYQEKGEMDNALQYPRKASAFYFEHKTLMNAAVDR